jgi:acyl-CoA thioesterase-1
METPPVRGWEYTLEFHRVYPSLATRYAVPLMPFLLAGVVGAPDLNLPDRFHPNAAGYERIAANIWPYLEPLLRATS